MKKLLLIPLLLLLFAMAYRDVGAAAPTTQAAYVTFSNITTTSVKLGWTRGNGNRCMAVIVPSNTNTDIVAPSNINSYIADNTQLNGSANHYTGTSSGIKTYIVYMGTGRTVNVAGLTGGTEYQVHVYEYNGSTWEFNTSDYTNNPRSFYTKPVPPSNLSTNHIIDDGFTCNWTSPINMDYLELLVDKTTGFNTPYTLSYTVDNDFLDTMQTMGLDQNTTHYWEMRTWLGTTVSVWSGIQTTATMPSPTVPANATICYNTAYTGGTCTSVSPNVSATCYWETDNNQYDVSMPVNSQTFTSSQTLYKRTVYNDGAGWQGWSTAEPSINLTVLGQFTPGTICANDVSLLQNITCNPTVTVCYGEGTSIVEDIAGSGGESPFTYQWQSATANSSSGSFSNISGATNNNYSPTGLTVVTWYRRVDFDGCDPGGVATNVVELVPAGQLVAGVISSSQTICYNTQPADITGTDASGGFGSYEYQWENSTDNLNWNLAYPNSSGVLGTDIGNLTATTYFRRFDYDDVCGNIGYTYTLQITVSPNNTAGTAGSDQTICYNTAPAPFTGTISSGGIGAWTSEWQSAPDNATWTGNLAATVGYSPGALTATTWFRRIDANATCGFFDIFTIQVTVLPQLTAGTLSSPSSICYNTNSSISGTAASGGNGTFTYNWQWSLDNATNWTNTGQTTQNLVNFGPLTVSTWFRRIDNDGHPCGPVITNSVQQGVWPIMAQGSLNNPAQICYNTAATITSNTLPTGGTGVYNYGWQLSANNSTWSNDPNTTNTSSYTTGLLTTSTYFRRFATSTGGCLPTVYTASVHVIVDAQLTGVTIGSAQSICNNTAAASISGPASTTGSNTSGGTSQVTYEWQSSTVSGVAGFADAAGTINGTSYAPGTLTQTTWFRRLDNDGGCSTPASVTSNAVQVTVYPAIVAGSIGPDQTICYNTTTPIGESPSSGGDPAGWTYQWSSSTSAGGTYTNITGATNSAYTTASLTSDLYYKRHDVNNCGSATYGPVHITVEQPIVAGVVAAAQTICYNTTPAPLTESTPTTLGSGNYSYLWQFSTTASSGPWTSTGVTTTGIAPGGVLTTTTWYRRVDHDVTCFATIPDVATNVIKVTVDAQLTAVTIAAAQSICYNTTPAALTGAASTTGSNSPGGTGQVTYDWQSSTTASTGPWASTGITTTGIAPGALTATTWYRREDNDAGCSSPANVTSNVVAITVYPQITAGTVSGDQTICYNTSAVLNETPSSGGSPAGWTYQWSSSTTFGGTYNNISGATNSNYSTPLLTSGLYYKRTDVNACGSATYGPEHITVDAIFAAGTIATSQTICSGQTPAGLTESVGASGGAGGYTYQWESSTTSSSAGFANASGTTTNTTYSPGALTQTTWFKRVDTDGAPCGEVASTNVITITVNPLPSQATMGANPTVCSGQSGTISPTGPGGANISYHYYAADNTTLLGSGLTFGAPAQNVLPGSGDQVDNYYIETYNTVTGCVASARTLVTVTTHEYPADPTFVTPINVCQGGQVTVTVATPPANANTFRWYTTSNALTPFFTGASYTTTYPNAGTTSYWVETQSNLTTCISQHRTQVDVNVLTAPAAPTVASTSICYNTSTVLSATAPVGAYTFNWYTTASGGSAFFQGANYTTPSLTTTTTYYVETVSNATACPSITRTGVTVTVYPVFAGGTVNSNQTICYNTTANLTATGFTGGNGTITYQWQNNTGSWADIGGATNSTYTTPSLTSTTQYRVEATSCAATLVPTGVTVTVDPQMVAGSVTFAGSTICYNTTATINNNTLPTGGSGTYNYGWQSSPDDASWANIGGATNTSYTTGALTTTTWYRRFATDPTCSTTVYTVGVEVIVEPQTVQGSIGSNQTICNGITPATFTESPSTGGSGGWNYLWQQSTDGGGTWGNTNPSPNLVNWTAGPLTVTTWFRRVDMNTCATFVEGPIVITVYPAEVSGTIGSNQSICYNTTPSAFTGTASTGGNPAGWTYQWQISTSVIGGPYSNISGATNTTYSVGANLTSTTYYRRLDANGCGNLTQGPITVTVYPITVSGSIGSNQSICYNVTPSGLTGTNSTGGDPAGWTYQWSSSTNNSTFNNIGAATNATYAPGALTVTTYYRRTDVNNCMTYTQGPVVITVYPAEVSGSIGSNQSICYNTTPTFSGTTASTGGNPAGFTYQWQSAPTSTGAWTNIGTNSPNYSDGPLTATTYFRRLDLNGCGNFTQGPISITVYPNTVSGSIGSNQTICNAATPSGLTGTASTGGDPAGWAYQWSSSTDNSTFNNIGGATNTTYSPGALTVTTYYRRTDVNTCQTFVQGPVTIMVYQQIVQGTIGPLSQTICSGGTPTFTSSAGTGGAPNWSYQWSSSTDGSTFANISGATNFNYTPGSGLTTTTYYRRADNNSCENPVQLGPITVFVLPAVTAVTISSNQTICYNTAPATLSGPANSSGSGSFSYNWQSSSTNSGPWSNTGGTSTSYTPGSLTTTTYYRRNDHDNSCGTDVQSNVLTITVGQPTVMGTIGSNQTICNNTQPASFTETAATGGIGGWSYLWQQSTDGGSTWGNVNPSPNLEAFSPGVLTVTTWYRRLETNTCATYNDGPIVITVRLPLAAGSINADQSICYNTSATINNGGGATGGSGTYNYGWQFTTSVDQTGWANIGGATSTSYTTGNLTTSTYFRRFVTDPVCSTTVYTGSVHITVYPNTVTGTIAANQTICYNTTPAAFTGTSSTGGNPAGWTYQWSSSPTSTGTWSNIVGATNVTYASGALTTTTWFRRIDVNSCGNFTVGPISVTVYGNLSAGTVTPSSQSVCYNSTATVGQGTGTTGGQGNYTYQWQTSSTNSGPWSNISNATTTSYTSGNLTTTTYYRLQTTDGCGTVATGTATVTVNANLAAGSVGSNQTISSGSTPSGLTETGAASGGTGSYTYGWQSSTDNSTWSTIGGATSSTYAPGALTITTYYRRLVTSSPCGTVATGSVTITVNTSATPTKLAINTIGTQTTGVAFSITVQSQTSGGSPAAVTTATGISITVNTGSGTVSGSGTIANGNSSVTFNVTYTKTNGDVGVSLHAATSSGMSLTAVNSNTFNVITNRQPTTQASSIVWGTITNSSIQLSWTNGDGDVRLVGCRQNPLAANTPAIPVSGVTYSAAANSDFSSAPYQNSPTNNTKVVYIGNGNSVTVTNLAAATRYHFRVTEFDWDGTNTGTANYLTSGYATGNPANNVTQARQPGDNPEGALKGDGEVLVSDPLPNPAKDKITFSIVLPIDNVVTVALYDNDGRLITMPINKEQYSQGKYTITVPFKNIAAGRYTLMVGTNNDVISQPVVIIP